MKCIGNPEESSMDFGGFEPSKDFFAMHFIVSTERKRHEEAKDEISKLNTELDYRIEYSSRNYKYVYLLNKLFQKMNNKFSRKVYQRNIIKKI